MVFFPEKSNCVRPSVASFLTFIACLFYRIADDACDLLFVFILIILAVELFVNFDDVGQRPISLLSAKLCRVVPVGQSVLRETPSRLVRL